MSVKKEKIQITLPFCIVEKIEEDIKINFTSKSLWFEKLVHNYFLKIENKENSRKNVIKLDL